MDAASLSDTDQDGLAAWKEWIGDTNPTDQSSNFNVQNMVVAENTGEMILYWNGTSTRNYAIESPDDLVSESGLTSPAKKVFLGRMVQ